ncbi:heparan sulfate 2-O-sulfotransferase 1-like [Phymastichus coffea]|uniref:heparan sulfate 2-O-sulfotransferase 1-like n=1 Tax=Phymastichus coffea TaxID=108790 RepID=UPI00273AD2B3|nr:heparan sulfate 2-O-sulfotransferase 1-like [Phymastichus coffea]
MRVCRSISALVCLLLTTGFIVITSKLALVDDQDDENYVDFAAEASYQSEDFYEAETISVVSSSTETSRMQRYVTPSLAELGEHGIPPATNEHILMVTRVPGAGSELLVLILQRLQGYNAFKHIRLPPGDEGTLSNLQQELLVEEITSIIRQEAIPLSFDGDVRFLNFSAYGRQAPTHISLVRDPLDPKTLEKFKKGDSATIYRGSISHFCGHDPRCSVRNNDWALEQAKANVLSWYPVVGVLDCMDHTVKVLEKSFPYFFEGASYLYDKIKPQKKATEVSSTLKPLTKKRLKNLLKKEVQFYEWVKSRLLNATTENG